MIRFVGFLAGSILFSVVVYATASSPTPGNFAGVALVGSMLLFQAVIMFER